MANDIGYQVAVLGLTVLISLLTYFGCRLLCMVQDGLGLGR